MKQLITITILAGLMAFAIIGQAQDRSHDGDRRGHSGPPDPSRMVAHLTETLDLSAEQAGALLTVLMVADQERQALLDEAREEMKPEFCALQLDTQDQVRNILSAEQYASLEALKAERMENHQAKQGGRRGELDCSDYQG